MLDIRDSRFSNHVNIDCHVEYGVRLHYQKHRKDALRKEDAHLDFDPLYDSQDFQIKDFAIRKSKSEKTKAEVTASFDNGGVKIEVVYSLVLTKAGWRIANVKYKDHADLVGMLSGK